MNPNADPTRRASVLEAIDVSAVLLGAAVIVLWAGHHFDFWYDDWSVILYRRSGGVDAFLAPHNGHLLLTTHVLYRALFAVVGIRHYWPYQAMVLATHLIVAFLIHRYARRRVPALVALAAAAIAVLLAQAWQVLLWPIGVNLTLPMISLFGVLLLRDAGSRHRDVGTAVLIGMALASSALGIAVTAGIVVDMAMSRERLRRWWSVAVPVALYAVWFVAARPHMLPPADLRSIPGADPNGDIGLVGLDLANITSIPSGILQLARAATVGLFGVAAGTQAWIAGAMAIVLGAAILVRRPPSRRLVVFGTVAVVYWVSIVLARAQLGELESPNSNRYVYAGALCLLALLVEAFDGARLSARSSTVVVAVALVVLRADSVALSEFRSASEDAFGCMHARQAAVLGDRAHIDPLAKVDPTQMPDVRAGAFLRAVDDLGTPSGDASPPTCS